MSCWERVDRDPAQGRRVVATIWETTIASKDKFFGPMEEGSCFEDSRAMDYVTCSKGISKSTVHRVFEELKNLEHEISKRESNILQSKNIHLYKTNVFNSSA